MEIDEQLGVAFLTGLADKKGRYELTLNRYFISQCHFSGHV